MSKWYTCARCDAGYDSGPLEQECTCVVLIDDAIEYGECPVCGAEPGQQCSVEDVSGWQPEGPAYISTMELARRVHPERGE